MKKKVRRFIEPFKFMERETRFELATSTLARLHSTTELFPHSYNTPSLVAESWIIYPQHGLMSTQKPVFSFKKNMFSQKLFY